VFIGGNHEASNYLSELPYGGWVAPNIFYMGLASVLKLGPNLRIGGISGIFKGYDYQKGHFERAPYSGETVRTVYHVRNLGGSILFYSFFRINTLFLLYIEIFRMKQLKNVDIILSHDWPRGIHKFGNEQALFRRKPFFRDEAERGILGSPPLAEVLNQLVPKFWFAAHMHVRFEAEFRKNGAEKNEDPEVKDCVIYY